MGIGRWIGGVLGFITAGPLGALAGFALGYIFESGLDAVNDPNEYNNREYDDANAHYQSNQRRQQQQYEGQRNSFLFSLLVLTSYIIRADGKVMHSEMNAVRNFLKQNFGKTAVSEGESILLKLFEKQKQIGAAEFREAIHDSCRQIAANMEYSQRLQLLAFLGMIAQADGVVVDAEVSALREVAQYLSIPAAEVESLLNLRGNTLEDAYRVLGIAPTATDAEVRAAYRKMALQHHPDKVATLGDDIKRAAEKKFKEINEAKEKIYKARGM